MLSVIPVPVGNREDITLRWLRLLKELDIFFCEDTRTTRKLMRMYEIDARTKELYSLTSFTHESQLQKYINILLEKNCWLVSEAWTPGLSDPWKSLIKLCREWNVKFEVLPWANALIPAVIAAYVDTSSFVYKWFPPTKKGRQTFFTQIIQSELPVFIYESVHRVWKTLKQMKELWFAGLVFMTRELSKMHEQHEYGTIDEMMEKIENGSIVVKGEFVLWFVNK